MFEGRIGAILLNRNSERIKRTTGEVDGCPQACMLKPEAPGTIHPFQENGRVKAKAGVLFATKCYVVSNKQAPTLEESLTMGQNGNILFLVNIHKDKIKRLAHFSDFFHGIPHPDLYTICETCFFKIGPSPTCHTRILFQGNHPPVQLITCPGQINGRIASGRSQLQDLPGVRGTHQDI
jgi:hypothetical protein